MASGKRGLADIGADAALQRHFGDRHQQPAVGNIMHGVDPARLDQAAHEIAMLLFGGQIDRRRGAFFAAFDLAQIDGLAQMALGFADQDDHIALALEGDGRHLGDIFIRPTPPIAGVGRMPSPLVSL